MNTKKREKNDGQVKKMLNSQRATSNTMT